MGGVTHWGTLLAEECNWGLLPTTPHWDLGLGSIFHYMMKIFLLSSSFFWGIFRCYLQFSEMQIEIETVCHYWIFETAFFRCSLIAIERKRGREQRTYSLGLTDLEHASNVIKKVNVCLSTL